MTLGCLPVYSIKQQNMIKLFMCINQHRYIRLLRVDRLAGFWLLLWPTLWALFYPTHPMPSLSVVGLFVIGTLMMRTAGCLINDWLDRDIDKYVARTAMRPLASGECSGKECLFALFICLFVSACCALALGYGVVLMSIPTLILVMLYPLAKRYMAMPQLVLAFVFALGVLYAFQVTEGRLTWHAWLVYLSVAFWVFAFDGVYAFNDQVDDKRLGLNSVVLALGSSANKVLMASYIAFYGLWLYLIYPYTPLSIFIGMVLLMLITGVQAGLYMQQESYWKGFLLNAWFGLFLFMLLLIVRYQMLIG